MGVYPVRGVDQIRTGAWRFCKPLPYRLGTTPEKSPHPLAYSVLGVFWAKDRIRTDDPNVGNVMLYQLSYFRK